MKIRTRLAVTFCLVALATMVVSIAGYVLVSRLSVALHEVGNVRLPSIQALLEMAAAFDDLARADRTLQNLDEPDGKKSIREEARRHWERFERGFSTYAVLPQTKEEAAVWAAFRRELDAARPLLSGVSRDGAESAAGREAPGDGELVLVAIARLNARIGELVLINANVADTAFGKMVASGERIGRYGDLILGLSAVVVLVQLWLAAVVGRAIAGPLAEAAGVLQRMAAGERGAHVPEIGDLELRELAGSVNHLAGVLRESEAMRSAIGANLPSSFLLQVAFDPGGRRRYLSVGASVERLTGIPAADLLEDPALLDRIVVDEDREAVASIYALAARGEAPTEFELRVRPRGRAEVRDFHVLSAVRKLPDGTRVADGIVTDVTERRRTERALAAAVRSLRAVNRCRHAVVHAREEFQLLQEVCDIIVEEAGYRICWVPYRNEDEARSVTVRARAGWGETYFTGRAMSWADQANGQGPVGTALRTGEMQWSDDIATDPRFAPWKEREIFREVRSVLALPLKEGGRPFAVLGIYSADPGPWDPAEVELMKELAAELEFGILALRARLAREAADEALRSHGSRMRLALEMARLVYFEVDFASQRIHFDEGFREIHRWPDDDTGGLTLAIEEYGRRFLSPDEAALMRADMELAQSLIGVGHSGRSEHRIRRGDGTFGVISVSRMLEDGPAGKATLFCGAIQDITESEVLRARMLQSQKMEAIGQLAGGVAHDFNNYLTVILGYAQMLLPSFEAGDRRRARVEEILKAAEHSAALTSQLLAFSRREVLTPRALDLNALVEDSRNMLRRLVGENIELEVALEPQLAAIWGDPGQLQQVIVNLAINARDAMPRGGKLELETANAELAESRFSMHASIPAGHYVRLAVRDTGTGISEDVQKQMFDPFFTTKGPGRGTGLGLSVVYGVVEQSGGYIEVESRPGAGASFLLYFPRSVLPVGTGTATAEPELPRGTETLLLVEDEESIRDLVKDVLEERGYRVLTAVDGEDALAVVADHDGPVDLVVTDVVMPRMSGGELARHLRESRPGLKVLFVSGYTDDAVLRQGIARDEVHFLQKPYPTAKLVRVIREMLDEA